MKGIRFNGPKMTEKDAIAYDRFVRGGKSRYSGRKYGHGVIYGYGFLLPFQNGIARKSDCRVYKELVAIALFFRECHLGFSPFHIRHPFMGFRRFRQHVFSAIDWYWGWVDERSLL